MWFESLSDCDPPPLVLAHLLQISPPHDPTRAFQPRIFPPPWSWCRFPVWGRRTPAWGHCMERSRCWWRWVGAAGTEKGAGVCQMAWSGGLDPDLGGAGWQKVETGAPAGILSCRKACQRGVPPEEMRPHNCQNSTLSCVSRIHLLKKPNYISERRRREAAVCMGRLVQGSYLCYAKLISFFLLFPKHSNTHTHTHRSAMCVPVSGS